MLASFIRSIYHLGLHWKLAIAFAVACPLFAGLISSTGWAYGVDPNRPMWLREARISPDAQTIAFVCRGQVWVVPSKGGDAVPVTGGRERLVMPHGTRMAAISPDGGRLAYVRQMSPEVEWRKREISDGTPDIWLYDLAGKAHRQNQRQWVW